LPTKITLFTDPAITASYHSSRRAESLATARLRVCCTLLPRWHRLMFYICSEENSSGDRSAGFRGKVGAAEKEMPAQGTGISRQI
ncbi:hypothetical protein, partial [Microvirga roseola]|uniref:hypothetical protein n=1 Tax=Microvirga roseola TaxID=2883126 RepID=UPI001E62127A